MNDLSTRLQEAKDLFDRAFEKAVKAVEEAKRELETLKREGAGEQVPR